MAMDSFMSLEGLRTDESTGKGLKSHNDGQICSPGRFSLSKNSEVSGQLVGIDKNNPIRAYEDQPKMERSYSDRNSMSEFEFAISATASYESTHGVVHMLAADELFFKGKLLPLYLPDLNEYGSELQRGVYNARHPADQFPPSSVGEDCQQAPLISDDFALRTTSAVEAEDADSLVAKSLGLIAPMSPKTPKRSIRLKSFFGLKKLAKTYCSCAANSAEVNMTSRSSSSPPPPIKFARRKDQKADQKNKHRSPALILQQNVPRSVSEACQCCRVNAENSPSEPLLRCCEGHKEVISPGYSVDTPKGHHQNLNHQCHESIVQRICNAATSTNLCSDVANTACCKQRSSKVSNTDADLLVTGQVADEPRVSGWSHEDGRQSVSHEKLHTCSRSTEEQCKEARRPSIHEDLREELSLERMGSCDLENETHGSLKQQQHANVAGTSVMNGFKSLSISRSKSLERNTSYSPKSLQRKYDQLRVMRQREGWRVLERSSSYNGSMHSMRVAPVLNVPIVCMSRSKSSNNATDRGHNLFPTRKNQLDVNFRVMTGVSSGSKPAASSKVKLLQSKRHSPHACNV